MSSIVRTGGSNIDRSADLRGLSTDIKPTKAQGDYIPHGSTWYNMDDCTKYMYNEDNDTWYNIPNGGGGTGNMQKSVYDPTNAVANAGGIDTYVGDEISTAKSEIITEVEGNIATTANNLINDTVGWTNKNLLPITLDQLKAINTNGTWEDNVYTYRGITITVDIFNNLITGINVNGANTTGSVVFKLTDNFVYQLLSEDKYYISDGVDTTAIVSGSAYISVERKKGESGESHYLSTNNEERSTKFTVDYSIYDYYFINIYIPNNSSINNAVFYPMIRRASISDDTYEPYTKTVKDEIFNLNSSVGNLKSRVGIVEGNIQTLNEIKANKSDLGTASTKNSTSVVTESSDLVESGAVKEYVDGKLGTIYSFHVSSTESNPANKITYIGDTEGMTPAHMDYTNDVFDWGSWGDAFFMPRPCMVRSDGTVDYYLKEDDYTKRIDGTASDVGNISYDGNAMMEWGQNGRKIWTKIVPDNDHLGADIHIADYQADSGFHDYSFHNCNGVSVDHFYTPIYNGSLDSNNKLRSMSGQQVMNKKTAEQELTYARANNKTEDVMWNTEVFADITLINLLLMLIGKSTDTQTVFGQGIHTSGSEAINNAFRTGVHNAKGMFYGTNSGSVTASNFSNAVKVFGMENWWGFQWRRYQGHVMVNGAQKVKNTYGKEDGSTVVGYNLTGDGYKSTGATALSGTSGNYIKNEYYTEDNVVPCGELSASASTYYCDGCWYNNGITAVPYRGGHSDNGAKDGAFYLGLANAASGSAWNVGTCLSCKPLATPDISTKADNSVIGNVEDGTTASQAYAVGEHFIRDGKFCTVTVAVTTSSTWTLGSNYVEGDMASAIALYKEAPITTGIDFNNLPLNSICQISAGGCSNTPLGNAGFYGIVETISCGTYAIQKAYQNSSGLLNSISYRSLVNGTWSDWFAVKKTGSMTFADSELSSSSARVNEKSGVVCVSASVYTTTSRYTQNQNVLIATLSGVAKPDSEVRFPVINSNGSIMTGLLTTGGDIYIYNYSTTSGGTITFNFSYEV